MSCMSAIHRILQEQIIDERRHGANDQRTVIVLITRSIHHLYRMNCARAVLWRNDTDESRPRYSLNKFVGHGATAAVICIDAACGETTSDTRYLEQDMAR